MADKPMKRVEAREKSRLIKGKQYWRSGSVTEPLILLTEPLVSSINFIGLYMCTVVLYRPGGMKSLYTSNYVHGWYFLDDYTCSYYLNC